MYHYGNNRTFRSNHMSLKRIAVDTCGFSTEKHTVQGVTYEVIFVPPEFLPHPAAWGCAYHGEHKVAHVRNDLTGIVRRFVIQHELYHLRDTHTWGGTVGAELRANFVPGLSDPIGFIVSIWKTITNRERRQFYLDMVRGTVRFND